MDRVKDIQTVTDCHEEDAGVDEREVGACAVDYQAD